MTIYQHPERFEEKNQTPVKKSRAKYTKTF